MPFRVPPHPSPWPPFLRDGAVLGAYLALGWAVLQPPLAGRTVLGQGYDTPQDLWNLAWVGHALATGGSLLFTRAMFAPHRVNLAFMTENLPMDLVGAAVRETGLSLTATYNLLVLISLAMDAFASYLLLRALGRSRPAAAAGGTLVGYGAYLLAQALGHLNLLDAFWGVLAVASAWALGRSAGRPRRALAWGLATGVLLAVQLWGAADYAVTALPATAVAAWQGCASAERRTLAPPLAAGALVALVVTQPLWSAWLGSPLFTTANLAGVAAAGSLDPVSLVHLPSFSPWLGPGHTGLAALLWSRHPPYLDRPSPMESQEWLSWAALAAAGAYLGWGRGWGGAGERVLIVTLIAVGLGLSLGPALHWNGHLTPVLLPALLLSYVPGLRELLPVRAALWLDLGVAAASAVALDRLGQAKAWRTWAGAAILAAASLAPIWPRPYPRLRLPDPAPYVRLRGTVLQLPLNVPYSAFGNFADVTYLYDQAAAGFRYRLVGGYLSRPPLAWIAAINRDPLNRAFARAARGVRVPVTPRLRRAWAQDVRREGITLVAVADGRPALLRFTAALTGSPGKPDGPLRLFSVTGP